MKKLAVALLLGVTATAAMAQHYHHRHYGYHGGHWRAGHGANWVLPAIIGGAIVYSTTRPAPVVIQQPPQVVTPPAPPIVLPVPPQGYRWESMVDAACNCTKFVLVPN